MLSDFFAGVVHKTPINCLNKRIVRKGLSFLLTLGRMFDDPRTNRIAAQVRLGFDDFLPLSEPLIKNEAHFAALRVAWGEFHCGLTVKSLSVCNEIYDAVTGTGNTHCSAQALKGIESEPSTFFIMVNEQQSDILFKCHALHRFQYLADDGTKEPVEVAYRDGTAVLMLEHFSTYAIVVKANDPDSGIVSMGENEVTVQKQADAVYYAAALYAEDGRFLAYAASEAAEDEETVTLKWANADWSKAAKVKVFFLDADRKPVAEAVTALIKGKSQKN